MARELGMPLVATSDAHYVNREDAEAQDVLLCINTGKFRTDTNRMRMESDQFFLRSPEEMYAAFPGLEDAVARSQADRRQRVDRPGPGQAALSDLHVRPRTKRRASYLRELCVSGPRRSATPATREMLPRRRARSPVVLERLDRELSVINKLGFPNYFLIVWDFVRHAREHGVPATARGSGVGALVCYALYLSHVCPIKYDLLFERFLDVNRKEAPDIDIDFCKDRRGEIIRYVKEKYGEENVAQIGTFGTLAARAAITRRRPRPRLADPAVDQIVAMVPEQLGISLDEALRKSDELKQVYDTDPRNPRGARPGPEDRGAGPQRRHARRRRRDRRPAADRIRAAVPRDRQDRHHHAVVDGRRRSGRPVEDGFSRPAEPDDPHARPSS